MVETPEKPRLLLFTTVRDQRGALSFAEVDNPLPFEIRGIGFFRVDRTSRANQQLHLVESVAERVVVILKQTVCLWVRSLQSSAPFVLERPDLGLYIPPGHRAVSVPLPPAAIVMVLSSADAIEVEFIHEPDDSAASPS